MEEVSSEASGLQDPCLKTRVGLCCKTLASKLGQCPSFRTTRMQTLERSPPILPTHFRSPELLPKPSSSHCHFQGRAFISRGPLLILIRLLNSYTHFNTQLKCYSLQEVLPGSYLPIRSHQTEFRRTGLRTGQRRRKEPLLLPREKGMGEGGAQDRNASRNMSGWASPFHGWKGQARRNDIAELARIPTGHLAAGWAGNHKREGEGEGGWMELSLPGHWL